MIRMRKQRNSLTGDITSLFIVIILLSVLLAYSIKFFYKKAYPVDYNDLVYYQSSINGLEPSLVFAVIRTESGFDKNAQSHVGAKGLMQITDETLGWLIYRTESPAYTPEDLFEPNINVGFGTALLRILINEFGTVENALCAYHAGWGNAKSWLENPRTAPDGKNIENIPFGDTNRYVIKVIKTQKIYKQLYNMD